MVEKGAKHIVLLSRSGTLKGQAKEQIAALSKAGANIVVRSCDVANKADVEDLVLRGLTDLPPIRGIIHGAMVLHVGHETSSQPIPSLMPPAGCSLRENDLRTIHIGRLV